MAAVAMEVAAPGVIVAEETLVVVEVAVAEVGTTAGVAAAGAQVEEAMVTASLELATRVVEMVETTAAAAVVAVVDVEAEVATVVVAAAAAAAAKVAATQGLGVERSVEMVTVEAQVAATKVAVRVMVAAAAVVSVVEERASTRTKHNLASLASESSVR